MDIWNKEEDEANLLLLDFMSTVQNWGLDCNGNELSQAIHTLQMFVWQHALQRNEIVCGEWYSKLPRTR